jgi:dipeptidyl aminopeptidase/acylaminoacyl peptidase
VAIRAVLILSCVISVLAACGGASNMTNTAVNNQPVAQSSTATANSSVETVKITSSDGVVLVGTFLESAKPDSPGLLLLHQWQSDRHSYDDFAKRMQTKGFNVLSIDGRGFGESTKKSDGTSVAPERSDEAVKAMLGDVDAAVGFLKKEKNVDPKRIGIVGASYGSSLALIYAADHYNEVSAVAMLSPGVNYFGNMPIALAVEKYTEGNLFLLAAEDDKDSADTVRYANPKTSDFRHPEKIYPSGGHGTALLRVGADDELDNFFTQSLQQVKKDVRTK